MKDYVTVQVQALSICIMLILILFIDIVQYIDGSMLPNVYVNKLCLDR